MSKVIGSFGRLWGRGYESLKPKVRRILSIQGEGATNYLQALITSDLLSEPNAPKPEPLSANQPGRISLKDFRELKGEVGKKEEKKSESPEEEEENIRELITPPLVEFSSKLRATCFLDHKGRIITDSLLWKASDSQYYVDVPGNTADELHEHLKQHKLRRSKVTIQDATDQMTSHVVFGTLNSADSKAPDGYMMAMDPRHPSLGMRVLSMPSETVTKNDAPSPPETSSYSSFEERHNKFGKLMSKSFPNSEGNYEFVRRLVGVAEGKELQGKVAIESNQEFLNAVSFKKGCYLGQELTARVHFTGTVRKRIVPLYFISTRVDIPKVWSSVFKFQQEQQEQQGSKEENTEKKLGEEKKELDEQNNDADELPTKLPRISVLAAGNLAGMFSGSFSPEVTKEEELTSEQKMKFQTEADYALEELQTYAKVGAKIKDLRDGTTIGQIVSEPLEGTNVVLAMVRLDQIGLLNKGNIWKRTNRVKIEHPDDDKQNDNSEEDGGKKEVGRKIRPLRYLPYLPLWWPSSTFDEKTGKEAK